MYADWEQQVGDGVRLQHRFKWDLSVQRYGAEELRQREERQRAGFLGWIDKAEWVIPVGLATLEPRWKSEFRRDRPFYNRLPKATSLEETLFLLWRQPLLNERTSVSYFSRYGRQIFATELQVGLEASRFWMLEGWREEIDQDYTGWTVVTQLTNQVGYQGYRVVTRVGAQWLWRFLAERENQRSSLLFMTINAGLK